MARPATDPPNLVATKSDKLSKTDQSKQLAAIAAGLAVDPGQNVLFSAKSRQGRDLIWKAINLLTGRGGHLKRWIAISHAPAVKPLRLLS